MSSDTAPSTSRSSDPAGAGLTIAGAGFCFAALQCVYFRELLSVFCGNEISIGIIFSVWLLSTGVSMSGAARLRIPRPVLVSLLCVTAVWGFFAIRLSRPLFGSGMAMGPLAMLCVTVVAVVPFTLVNGLLLGALFSGATRPARLYGAENAGAVFGALLVFLFIVLSWKNSLIAAASLVLFLPVAFAARQRLWTAAVVVFCIACFVFFDHASVQWKYPGVPVSGIVYGH
jgi:hypothetical protein